MTKHVNAHAGNKPSLFERLTKSPADTSLQRFFHVPLQQKALTNTDPEWNLTEVEKKVRHCGILFEYLHRRFGKDAGALNTVLLSDELMKWLCAPAQDSYPLPITNMLWLILHHVNPFDRLYDIKTKRGIENFYQDLVGKYCAAMDLPYGLIPDSVFDYLAQDYPCTNAPPEPLLPLSRGLAHIWREFIPEVPFAPHDAKARITFFVRFLVYAQVTECDPRLFSPKLLSYLNAPLFAGNGDGVHATGLVFEILRLAGFAEVEAWRNPTYVNENLHRFFNGAFASLVLPESVSKYHSALAHKLGVAKADVNVLQGGAKTRKKYITHDETAHPHDTNKAWVNIIETGDVNSPFNAITRQLQIALQASATPATSLFPPHAPYTDFMKARGIDNMPWGKINLVALDASKCADMMLSQGLATMNGRINIGYCTWETSQLPKAHFAGLDLLDEIWVPSEYVKNIFAAATEIPVMVMPYPVEVSAPSNFITRQLYDIPQDAFVFMTSVDIFDLMSRKNPLAAAKAFQKAFPENANVRLIIKTRNLDKSGAPREHSHLHQLQVYTHKDPRIILLHQNMSDADMAAFLNLSDCYVSLHRSSAYGRTVMEAMALGKPVIVTADTGCADYANEKTVFLVESTDCSIVYDAYQYLDRERGHRWRDPDMQDAVKAMQRVVTDAVHAQTLAKSGQAFITQHYNAKVTGAKMRARIEQLMNGQNI